MTKDQILDELTERNLLTPNMQVILVEGFEDAFIGISHEKLPKAVYDYWICLDLLIQRDKMEFDNAVDDLDEFINQDLGKQTPIYLKAI